MKLILSLLVIVCCCICQGQTTTTTVTTRPGTNTGYGGAYVPPVITKTYTTKSDPYVWDNSKGSFSSNASYSSSSGGASSGNTGGSSSSALRKPRWQIRIDKLQAENNKRQTAVDNKNAAMLDIISSIVNKINELVKNYEDGKYLDAYDCTLKISELYHDVLRISYDMQTTNGITLIPGLPDNTVSNIQKFYTLLTYNKVGADEKVMSEYLASYTSCSNPDNNACYEYMMTQKIIKPPFTKACNIRDCPEKIWGLEGLSMEDIFVIELAFTESAAILGYIDFARDNFKSIMNYYSGKIVLSPYYLDLAAAIIAMDQRDYAAKFFEQYKLENGNEPEGKMKIKSFLQKIGSFYLLKGDELRGKAYFDDYLAMGDRNIAERQAFITLLGKRNYTKARENKLITTYLAKEMDSLLADKNFVITKENDFCLLLSDRCKLYMKNKQYTEAKKSMTLIATKCYIHFSKWDSRVLRCLTGEADQVMAEEDKLFNERNSKGQLEPLDINLAEESKYYMIMLNEAGLFEKCLSVFEDMKNRKIRKNFEYIYATLQGEALISYYNLKDYKNARKCMDDDNKTPIKYKRYWAKLYALDGDLKKSQEIYKKISTSAEIVFDEEDFHFQEM